MICKAALLDRGEIDIMDDSRDYLNLMKANKEMCAAAKAAEEEVVRNHKLFKATCHTARDLRKAVSRAQKLDTESKHRIRVVFTQKNPARQGLQWFMKLKRAQRQLQGKYLGGPSREFYPRIPHQRENAIFGERRSSPARILEL